VVKGRKAEPLLKNYGTGKLIWSPLPLELGDSMEALVAFYRTGLAQARVDPVFSATPRTPSVLVLPSVFRNVVLYTFVSEIDRDTTMQVTHSETRTRFPVSVPAGRTAMVIVDRRNGKMITSQSRAVSENR
jgi:hypothetical protein